MSAGSRNLVFVCYTLVLSSKSMSIIAQMSQSVQTEWRRCFLWKLGREVECIHHQSIHPCTIEHLLSVVCTLSCNETLQAVEIYIRGNFHSNP